MRYSVILILSIISLCSCVKNSDNCNSKHPPIIGFQFTISNFFGEDLLNPEIQGTYNTNNIKLYYLINGEKEEVFSSNNKYPRNYKIDPYDGRYYITIFPNSTESEEYPITYVEWSDQDTDTIECAFDRGEDKVTIIRKIWFNDKLVWNFDGDPIFEIVK